MSTEDFLKNRERLEWMVKKDKETPVPIVPKTVTSDVETVDPIQVPLEQEIVSEKEEKEEKEIVKKKSSWKK